MLRRSVGFRVSGFRVAFITDDFSDLNTETCNRVSQSYGHQKEIEHENETTVYACMGVVVDSAVGSTT